MGHPHQAFCHKPNKILQWLNHVNGSHGCILLLMMYGILKNNQKCKCCGGPMKLTFNQRVQWKCEKQKNKLRCKTGKSIYYASEYFRGSWIRPSNLNKFFIYMYNRFDGLSKKKSSTKSNISKKTATKYQRKISELFRLVREMEVVKLGVTGSTIEFDGAYYRPKYNYKKSGGI